MTIPRPNVPPSSGIQPTHPHATPGQRLDLFAIEALLVLVALALAAVVMCALEQRLGIKPPGFEVIMQM